FTFVAPPIRESGEVGFLHLAEPLDACTRLKASVANGSLSPFILIIRGGCSFHDKVKNAQSAGFEAAIVYDDKYNGGLVTMAGKSEGISIHAVFISKVSGEELKKYVNHTDVELWIIPYFMNSPWAIWAISFVSLLALSAVLAACFFVRGRRITHIRRGASRVHVFHGMSNRSVEAMQSQLFSEVLRGDSTTKTCAICLEDYSVGEKLRILPCHHRFHANCVDSWLTMWRTFCPMCKQDAQTSHGVLPASETTPLCIPTASSSSTLPSFPDQLC
ncbi:receptor homology region, transmembrane domain- and RING domain-containing protein 2-like, partial [Phalaenopsis equestris]|uniref:receptor homology region, transmembrane domain- and RING domain-containing protein 2-like n=1 Tax=Phalaenopsis equestris TaxID=78828 RepID=UPI0009E5DDE4